MSIKRKYLLNTLLCLSLSIGSSQLFAQSSYFRVDDERVNFYMDMIDVKSNYEFHTEFKPFTRNSAFGIRKVQFPNKPINLKHLYGVHYKDWMHYSYSEFKDSQVLR